MKSQYMEWRAWTICRFKGGGGGRGLGEKEGGAVFEWGELISQSTLWSLHGAVKTTNVILG